MKDSRTRSPMDLTHAQPRASRWTFRLFLLTALQLAATACPGDTADDADASATGGPPTEAEIQATIERVFSEQYATDAASGATSAGIELTFGSIQVGAQTQAQVEWGESARDVYPVRVPVTVRASYRNYPGAPAWERTSERGVRSNDVFLFYRDPFGEWTFKTGSP